MQSSGTNKAEGQNPRPIQYGDRAIYVRDKCVCVYCGFDGTSSVLAWHQLVIDHVIPLKCKDGDRLKSPLNVEVNKRVVCGTCNSVKRGWDKKFDNTPLITPTPERVNDAIEQAKKYVLDKYAAEWDTDFENMMAD